MIELSNVSYTYALQEKPALTDISFSVAPGEIMVCTGVSGCGKSTLLRTINGLCPQYFKGRLSGTVCIGGTDTKNIPLHILANTVGTLFQDPENQFFALTVQDEIIFALEMHNVPKQEIQRRLEYVTELFSLHNILTSTVYDISEGQKQKVALASLLVREPKVLVLDEPTANLDPEATEELAQSLAMLREKGLAIFIVDHRLYWLDGLADNVLIMEHGTIAHRGIFSLLHEDSIRERYGLRSMKVLDNRSTLQNSSAENAVCSLRGLCFGYKDSSELFCNAEIDLYPGITALLGENGVGKTTLVRLLAGLETAKKGTVSIDGVAIPTKKLLQYVRIVLQNTDHQLCMRTVHEEIYSATHTTLEETRLQRVQEVLEVFALTHLHKRHPQSLSGGEKQRLVLACAVASCPRILLLDEPTSGVDGHNMKRIANTMQELANNGTCVIVITHDLELLHTTCTRGIQIEKYNGIA